MAAGVHLRPQLFPVGATPQDLVRRSVTRSASPAQLINRGREVLVFGSMHTALEAGI